MQKSVYIYGRIYAGFKEILDLSERQDFEIPHVALQQLLSKSRQHQPFITLPNLVVQVLIGIRTP